MKRDDPRHGTKNGYSNLRCRCDDCRAAWAAYCYKRQKERAASNIPFIHGTENGYGNYGCRCPSCTAARSAANLARYHRRKARELQASRKPVRP